MSYCFAVLSRSQCFVYLFCIRVMVVLQCCSLVCKNKGWQVSEERQFLFSNCCDSISAVRVQTDLINNKFLSLCEWNNWCPAALRFNNETDIRCSLCEYIGHAECCCVYCSVWTALWVLRQQQQTPCAGETWLSRLSEDLSSLKT